MIARWIFLHVNVLQKYVEYVDFFVEVFGGVLI